MSFNVEVIADSSGQWVGNGLFFAPELEANDYANDLFCRWTAVREKRVVTSEEPANYSFAGFRLAAIEKKRGE